MKNFKVGDIILDDNLMEINPMVIDDINNQGTIRGHYTDGHGNKSFVIGSLSDPYDNLHLSRYVVYSESGAFVGIRDSYSKARRDVREFGGTVKTGDGKKIYSVPEAPLDIELKVECGLSDDGDLYLGNGKSGENMPDEPDCRESITLDYFRYLDKKIEKADLDKKFVIGDILSAPMLYGGTVFYTVRSRIAFSNGVEEMELQEGHYSEDDGSFVDDGIKTVVIETDETGTERFKIWEYKGETGYAYPENRRKTNE